jgi:hypothetical protein
MWTLASDLPRRDNAAFICVCQAYPIPLGLSVAKSNSNICAIQVRGIQEDKRGINTRTILLAVRNTTTG